MANKVIVKEDYVNLTGREQLQTIIDGKTDQPGIGLTLDFRLVEIGDGIAVFEGMPSEKVLNPNGTVHGGYALALIDSAAGCAAHSLVPKGYFNTTIETKVNFVKAILPSTGLIRCEGRVLQRGRQIMSAEAYIYDKNRVLLAHGTSTVMVLAARV
jgi:uncharacterized protein (TIGR00369 family)